MTSLTLTPCHRKLYPGWVHIEGQRYYAVAKIYDDPSQYGFLGGRISKLSIWRLGDPMGMDAALFNYDRGMDRSDLDARGFLFLYQIVDQVDGHALWRFLAAACGYLAHRIANIITP